MKDLIPDISFFILSLVLGFCLILFFEIRVMKQTVHDLRIDNINLTQKNNGSNLSIKQDSLIKELSMMRLERQSYVDVIGRESDRFIVYVSVLFLIFTLIGFGFFVTTIDARIKEFERRYEEEYKTQNEDYIVHKNNFKELEYLTYDNIGNLNFLVSETNGEDRALILSFLTRSAAAHRKAFSLKNEATQLVNIEHSLRIALNAIIELPQNIPVGFNRNREWADLILNSLDDVSTLENENIKDICAEIRVRLNTFMGDFRS